MNCYKKNGSCGVYEMNSCSECPASKPEYQLKESGMDIYVATLNGNVKDHYVAIGLSETAAEQNLVNLYYGDKKHTKKDLGDEVYITTFGFIGGNTAKIF